LHSINFVDIRREPLFVFVKYLYIPSKITASVFEQSLKTNEKGYIDKFGIQMKLYPRLPNLAYQGFSMTSLFFARGNHFCKKSQELKTRLGYLPRHAC